MIDKAPYSLDHFADTLAAQRDEHQARYDEYGDRIDLGYASAFKLALSFLYTHTNGDFGQLRHEQSAAEKAKDPEVSE